MRNIAVFKAADNLRNGVNRRVNCETANLTKVVDAAQEQIAAIRRLQDAQVEPVKIVRR